MEEPLQSIFNGILEGDREAVRVNVVKGIELNFSPAVILNQAMVAAMAEVGKRFEEGEYYVPEMLIAARAMKEGLELLKPLLKQAKVEAIGRVAAGTVKGDLHDIGKNLVGMMLEGAGFKVVDAGINVEAAKFVELAKANNATVIGASALLTTTMTNMKEVVDVLKKSDMAGKVKIMIGGAPVTQAFCDEIGADGYAPDAASAADLAKKLAGK